MARGTLTSQEGTETSGAAACDADGETSVRRVTDIDDGVRDGPWILRGKLRPPRDHAWMIERSGLVRWLDKLAEHRVVVVVAPPGFGKTTLISQWSAARRTHGERVAWLSVDPEDADSHRFLCYAILALARAGVDMGRLEMFAEQGLAELPTESVLVRLLAAVEAGGVGVTLVLDDYHRLGGGAVDALVGKLVENAPANLRLVVSSRVLPGFPVTRLCLTGRAIELDGERLRFSDEEIRRALDGIVAENVVETIAAQTEGWPVAVQLARLAYRDGRALAAEVSGRHGHIARFFSEQVVRGLPEQLQRFLTRTSVVEQFNANLADALCGERTGARRLKALGNLGSLVVVLDAAGGWYRYHHLFEEFLRELLAEREPEQIPALHARASAWFEADGDSFRAVRHAVLAGDVPRAARLIEVAGGWELILFGGIGYLRNLLGEIPAAEIGAYPRLGVAKAYLLIKLGEIAAARGEFDRACAGHRMEPGTASSSPEFERDVVNIGAMLSAYEDDDAAAARWCALGPQRLPNGEPDSVTNGMLACLRVVREITRGEFETARETLRGAMRHMREGNSVLGLNYCYVHGAVNNFHQCNLSEAVADARESSAMAEDNFGSDSGLKSLADVVLGSLLFWRNRLTDDDWVRFEEGSAHVAVRDGWLEIYALGLETAVERALLVGDIDAALRAIEAAKRLAHRRFLDRLDWHADAMSLLVAVEQGDDQDAAVLEERVGGRHPIGAWRKRPGLWRNHVHACFALARRHAEVDPGLSRAFVSDAKECCSRIGAEFLRVRSMCLDAWLLDLGGDRVRAVATLMEAVETAAPQGLPVVLARTPAMGLLRHAQRRLRADFGDTATRRFVGEAINLAAAARKSRTASSATTLSPREMDVLMELERGGSNKHIARALDMTEHTVKFHLTNLYRKLGVNRRTEALRAARERGVI